MLVIEGQLADCSLPDPIYTYDQRFLCVWIAEMPFSRSVCPSKGVHPMNFALDASTKVSFYGNRYLHGWIQHQVRRTRIHTHTTPHPAISLLTSLQFEGDTGLSLNLVARARQFSSFIVLIGAIASADTFEPKYAILLHNKALSFAFF